MQKLKQNYPIVILLALAFLIGSLTLSSRGESWDEFLLHKYANRSLNAYQSWALEGKVNITLDDLGGYGPSFVMLDELAADLFSALLPINRIDLYHLINFSIYLAGIWAFYDLGIRWLNRTSAIGATLLLMTQPIYWGHAFMNSKDIPFLAFFLLSLAFGFRMLDSDKPILSDVSTDRLKRMLALLTAIWLASVFGLFAATEALHSFIADLVRSAASGQTNIISLVASDILTAPPAVYIQKFFILFLRIRSVYLLLFTALLLYLYYRHSRSTFQSTMSILIPGILLGFTTSIRSLGPFAGLIVAAYGLRVKGKKAIPALVLYAAVGIIAMYLTWPYLWENPIGHLFESIRLMSAYPWNGEVLFNGQRYAPTELPYAYLPVLLGIQLTEPVWLLFLIGFVITVIEYRAKRMETVYNKRLLLELVTLWFVIPILGFIIFRPTLYDNFRQLLFILPPVFLMAGVVFSRIKHPAWQIALIALVTIPGLVSGVSLQPYEYLYYNRFIGGVHGAQNRFELDYWGTSYREAAEHINSIAPANSSIWVEGPAHVFGPFARIDLKVLDAFDPSLTGTEYYVVILARHDLDKIIAPDAETIYTVAIEGVPLAIVKKP